MGRKHMWTGILLAVVLLGTMPLFSLAAPGHTRPAQEGENLLKNPGFEGITCAAGSQPGWCNDNWTRDTFNGTVYQEVFTPQGWVTYWSQATNPSDGRKFGRPECKVIPNVAPFVGPPKRINSGNYAIMQFGFFRAIDSGVYQVVTGLSPQATVQASAYAQAWTCDDDDHAASSCGDDFQMLFQVGIDPNGGTDPWNPNIVWASGYSYDKFRKVGPVQAQVGDGGAVTVFLRATAKWSYKHNDVYWDDASLTYTSPPAAPTDTPLPPPPTATPGPSPTPLPPPTPRPDGASVHIVQSGDTLFGIALMYGVDVDQIRKLNATSLGANDLIVVGQELVISLPTQQPSPTPLPTPPESEPTAAPDSPAPGGSGGGASICVLAYHDRNGDTFRDSETDELLPNAEFTVADASGVVNRYTSDGISEPYCFTGLAAGAYRVIQNAPPGYEPSGQAEWPVAVAEGTSLDIQFGNVRSGGPAAPGETTEPTPASGVEGNDEPSNGNSAVGTIFATVAKVSGVLVLLLAAGMAVLFVLNRRRM